MLTRDKHCIITDEHGRHELEIADGRNQLCYTKVASLARRPNVKFSNTTVEDLALSYGKVSHALKLTKKRLDEQKEKIDAGCEAAFYAPALIEVFEILYQNLPDVKDDIAVQTLEEACIAAKKLQELVEAYGLK